MSDTALWRVSPRVGRYATLVEQLMRDETSLNANDEVTNDKFFGGAADVPNAIGAFSISGRSTVAFASQVLVGPTPGILPTTWFKLDTRRVVLAEMEYQDQSGSGLSATVVTRTLYLANYPYYDDENGRAYSDCIKAVPRYNRSINRNTLRGRWTSSIGSLEIDNASGAFDSLLTYACDGSEIRFYIGDAGDKTRNVDPWLRSQFIFAFSARVAKVSAPSWDRISIALKDSSLLLNQTIGGSVAVGGTGPSADAPRPWNFGYVRQIACVQKDSSTLTYAFNENGTNATLVAVRDRGYSVGFTDNGDGTFNLLAAPAGSITADVLVDRGIAGVDTGGIYPNTTGSYRVSDAFYQVAGVECGLVASGLYAGPSGNFRTDNVSNYYVGINIEQSRDAIDVLNDLCDTGNCYYTVRRDGQFTFGLLRPEAVDFEVSLSNVFSVGDDDVIGGIRIDHAEPSFYDVQGISNVNWTQNNDFASGLTATQLAQLQRDGYRTATYGAHAAGEDAYLGPDLHSDGWGVWLSGAPELYHLTLTRSVNNKTVISNPVDDPDGTTALSDWEALRRAQFLPWLEFIDITVDLSYFQVEIGDVVTLELTRFSLAGLNYQVVTVDIALTEGTIALGLVRRRPAITSHWTR